MLLEYVPTALYTNPVGTSAWNTRLAASYKPNDGSCAPGRYVAWMIEILDLSFVYIGEWTDEVYIITESQKLSSVILEVGQKS